MSRTTSGCLDAGATEPQRRLGSHARIATRRTVPGTDLRRVIAATLPSHTIYAAAIDCSVQDHLICAHRWMIAKNVPAAHNG